ncbi:MAG: GNAT family N-acetyltransferase [Candidatus Woesearchaeota archaeon]|nr:GNAT family N-acetyltransferase [Candidatus Woesearchaeota archaeon]
MRAVIKGKRVTLRTLRKSDADKITEYCKNPAISRWTRSIPYPYVKKYAIDYIKNSKEKWNKKEAYNFVITRKEKIIGSIALMIKNEGIAELGYWIAKPYWGEGYATEASKLVIKEGFKKLKLHKIYAHHIKENLASGRVMQKLGMKKEGIMREHTKKQGKYRDLIQYGVLRREFKG